MKTLAFAILGSLLSVGCSVDQSPRFLVLVDPVLDIEVVRAAAKEWETAAPGLSLTVAEGREDIRQFDSDAPQNVIAFAPLTDPANLPDLDAWTSRNEGRNSASITVRNLSTVVAAHELGHAIGLAHAETGIMRDGASGHVTCADVTAYCAVWNVSPCTCGISESR